ncbi:hypothetical protein BOTBODRAFT_55992 [Botryobasidium botryosum FD-172 SS1]|uniref:Uncharacterized protein n=1 Tax=Botryobasidium botryosum (strain FD-172 SS1) TaxID=930990 RepID=A0A067MD30_BOTB1|nr:hypothetical protein BOTBODRAFT_55992 [Botryobasidium botryosum FD-172 SS1]
MLTARMLPLRSLPPEDASPPRAPPGLTIVPPLRPVPSKDTPPPSLPLGPIAVRILLTLRIHPG